MKPAKLRGVKSQGMLLAAEKKDEEGNEIVEVIFLDHAEAGDPVLLQGDGPSAEEKPRLKIDKFFSIPISVKDHNVYVGGTLLTCGGKAVTTKKVDNGEVG